MKRVVKASTVLLVILTIFASQAEASFIDMGIIARVRSVDDFGGVLGGAVNIGDLINGMYTYDSTTPDSNIPLSVGDYWHTTAPFGINLSVNNLTFRTDPNNVNFLIEVVNDSNNRDNYLLRSLTMSH